VVNTGQGIDIGFDTKNKAKAVTFDYIEVFYNNKARRHTRFDGMSPEAFEETRCKQG